MITRRDLQLARRAKKYGARYSLRIILEAKGAGLPISRGFALVEQETNFRNIFGHDPTIFIGAGEVTKAKYLAYKRARGISRMQGVGLLQLTYWTIQDAADRLGGCWIPKYNLRQGFRDLATLIRRFGVRDGIMHYNGSGPAAQQYAKSVLALEAKWHNRLK